MLRKKKGKRMQKFLQDHKSTKLRPPRPEIHRFKKICVGQFALAHKKNNTNNQTISSPAS